MDEEKRRLQSTREEVGDSSGGRRIDLESGTVRISRRPGTTPVAQDGAEAAEDGAPGTENDALEGEIEAPEADQAEDADARDGDAPAQPRG